MSFADTSQIRDIIKGNTREDAQLADLKQMIGASIPRLHAAIQLPARNAGAALADFVFRYIHHAPNFIDALRGLSQEAGIGEYAEVFLQIAESFFLDPPREIGPRTDLQGLIYQSYLCHRLIEEVTDRVVGRCGIPLAPMNMTRANLIVHQLIGEPFANDLDFVVHYTTEQHLDKEALLDNDTLQRYVRDRESRGWSSELDRWPCLAADLAIGLALPGAEGAGVPQTAPAQAVLH
ncbi:hypothetical protein ACXYTJ_02680 [Gilvimarinus sp. F26214L]|uniref:hypothetical protein n=1 Tax=Gilvimarinus sp. DZF01 TaxID=3461371 RepID=UPI0040468428